MLLTSDRLPGDVHSLLDQIQALKLSAHAGKAHYELVDFLTDQGFFVECEHTIYCSQGGQERIDIMAHKEELILAIEVDARFKRKSVQRLQRLTETGIYLIICLLNKSSVPLPTGIDAIVVTESSYES